MGDRERGIELAVSVVPFVFTAVAFGPLAALVVGVLANLADTEAPVPEMGGVYASAGAYWRGRWSCRGSSSHAYGTGVSYNARCRLAASVAHLVIDVAIAMGTLAIRGSGSPLAYRTILPFILSTALYVPVVGFLAYGYSRYSFAVVATFLLPVLALQRVAQLYQQQRQAAAELREANIRLEHANMSFAAALVATLDARDRYTAGHSTAVAIYS